MGFFNWNKIYFSQLIHVLPIWFWGVYVKFARKKKYVWKYKLMAQYKTEIYPGR